MRMRSVLAAVVFMAILAGTAQAAVEAVSTFHSIGLAWSGSGGSATTVCDVRYRRVGASEWKTAYPLWFDARAVGTGTTAARPAGEYRGSLVGLSPGTMYEIELALRGGGATQTIMKATWSESFPIGTTRMLPATSSATLSITSGGTAAGYALFTAAPGQTATIDVAGGQDYDIVVDAPFVIIRGLTLKGARINAIDLGPNAHDVVIENSDISGFGRISTVDGAGTNWGSSADAAIYCNNHRSVERIIVQRNRIHHPRSDANNWEEPRPSRGGDAHPLGPQAVTFETCGGNHVFRYNDIFSDTDHYFNDAIGGGDNFSFEGFPHSDSDIYGNRISECWDDGIEAEGGNRNVRIWGNRIDQTFVKIAVAATAVGPAYVFRNVSHVSRRSHLSAVASVDAEDRGPFLKIGTRDAAYRGGRIFVFHNTTLQPRDARYTLTLGVGYGLADSAGTMTGVLSRNNILQNHKTNWASISDSAADPSNGFDFDLYNGTLDTAAGQEPSGWHDVPMYAAANPTDVWALAPTSRGFDQAQRLPGFNDDFLGAGPDVGAYEAGAQPLEFGAGAYLTTPTTDGGVVGGDGATSSDAGRDGGAIGPGDGGDGGCGCRTTARTGPHGWLLSCAAAALVARRRRRRT